MQAASRLPLVSEEQQALLVLPRLLVIDLELTCGPGVTQDIQEIIEVGACVLEMCASPTPSASTSVYVRPERSPITKFCTHLTGITWERVANQPNFLGAAPLLSRLVDDAGAKVWVSWGQDQALLQQQCDAVGVANPFEHLVHVDIKRLLSPLVYRFSGGTKPKGAGAGVGLETAMKELGIPFEGRSHSGSVDAWNTARLVAELRRMAEPHLTAVSSPRHAALTGLRRNRP